MKVNYVENVIEYSRTIEGMGEGLVLFKLSVISKRIGQNYHLFFENKRKPPLDIAINPDSRTVEYCSYFAQDEKLIERVVMNSIQYKDGLVTVEEEFCEDKKTSINLSKPYMEAFARPKAKFLMSLTIEENFEILKSNNDIFILCVNLSNVPLQAYRIDNLNYLLFSGDCNFCGILLKDISEKEWAAIKNSKCM